MTLNCKKRLAPVWTGTRRKVSSVAEAAQCGGGKSTGATTAGAGVRLAVGVTLARMNTATMIGINNAASALMAARWSAVIGTPKLTNNTMTAAIMAPPLASHMAGS